MNIFQKIYRQAKNNPKKILLPEGDEPRVIEACAYVSRQNLAKIILLGKSKVIFKKAKKNSLDLSKIEIIDPRTDQSLVDYVHAYWDLRKHRGVGKQSARDLLLSNYVYYGAMMLRHSRVDGFVAGACHATSEVARAALHCIERVPAHSTASGSFLIEVKNKRYGESGLFLFADCAVVPEPSAEQLADIAVVSAELWSKITGYKPRIAMLSFSSKGSGTQPSVVKVRKATALVKKARPSLLIDGELQVDSAVDPTVAKIKVPGSRLAGRANILIFPSLNAGNIAYKMLQRLGQARVVGPIIQGLLRPCSDLSRGCSPQEIVDAIVLTAVRAK